MAKLFSYLDHLPKKSWIIDFFLPTGPICIWKEKEIGIGRCIVGATEHALQLRQDSVYCSEI